MVDDRSPLTAAAAAAVIYSVDKSRHCCSRGAIDGRNAAWTDRVGQRNNVTLYTRKTAHCIDWQFEYTAQELSKRDLSRAYVVAAAACVGY